MKIVKNSISNQKTCEMTQKELLKHIKPKIFNTQSQKLKKKKKKYQKYDKPYKAWKTENHQE